MTTRLVVTTAPFQTANYVFERQYCTVELRYNPMIQRWSMNLFIDSVPVLHGQRVVHGTNLLGSYRFGIGGIVAIDWERRRRPPDYEALTRGFTRLYHIPQATLEEMLIAARAGPFRRQDLIQSSDYVEALDSGGEEPEDAPPIEPPPQQFFFYDDFNRTNQNLEVSPDWTRVGGNTGDCSIVGSAITFNNSSAAGALYLCPDQGSNNHETEVTIRTNSGAGGNSAQPFPCVVRAVDANNFIGARAESGHFRIQRRVGGSLVGLGEFAAVPVDGDVMRLVADGNNIRLFVNGVLRIGPLTETAHNMATRQGMVSRGRVLNRHIHNFKAGSL